MKTKRCKERKKVREVVVERKHNSRIVVFRVSYKYQNVEDMETKERNMK
jgi:hypothetical protein